MPCIFLRNVPKDFKFSPSLVRSFHRALAEIDSAEIGSFEIHVENTHYSLLMPDGLTRQAANVHVFVEGHERPLEVKRKIAQQIHFFLVVHNIGNDSDITFRDSPSETFFLNGVIVQGGRPRQR